jgi:hypothetical protein
VVTRRSISELLAKLDRPPSGPNWVRFIADSEIGTAQRITAFVRAIPVVHYRPAYATIKDRIELGIPKENMLNACRRSGAPEGYRPNEDLVSAFWDYDQRRRYSAAGTIGFEKEFFRVSRDILVPVAPLSIIRESGKFIPIFLCGWTEIKLSHLQRRLLMTIYEDSFLSLTDFQSSPAEILFFPKRKVDDKIERIAEVWSRGDYQQLSDSELRECVERYVLGRDLARQILLSSPVSPQEERPSKRDDEGGTRDMFDEDPPA